MCLRWPRLARFPHSFGRLWKARPRPAPAAVPVFHVKHLGRRRRRCSMMGDLVWRAIVAWRCWRARRRPARAVHLAAAGRTFKLSVRGSR